MPDMNSSEKVQKLTLYVCSDCEGCAQAAFFLKGWSNGRSGVRAEIVTLEQRSEQVVQFGISHTPAFVINNELVGQKMSIESLAELLQTDHIKPGASPPFVGGT